jgi:hypothetical protein
VRGGVRDSVSVIVLRARDLARMVVWPILVVVVVTVVVFAIQSR